MEMVRLGGRLQVLQAPLVLEEAEGTLALVGEGTRLERNAAEDRGVLRVAETDWVLLGGLHVATRSLTTASGRPVTLTGLVGRFATPPGGRIVREQVAMLLASETDDPVLTAFARFPGDDRPTTAVGFTPAPPGPRLLPRIVTGTLPLQARGFDDDGQEITVTLAAEAIGDDLAMVYVEDTVEGVRRLTDDEAMALEPDVTRRRGQALANLAELPLVRIVGEGPIFPVRRAGFHEAAFLVLPAFWRVMDPLLDGPRLVAMPRHDVLLVTGDTGPERQDALRATARRHLQGPNVLSRELYRYDRDVWVRVPPTVSDNLMT